MHTLAETFEVDLRAVVGARRRDDYCYQRGFWGVLRALAGFVAGPPPEGWWAPTEQTEVSRRLPFPWDANATTALVTRVPKLWIDADAAPRACKDVLFRASQRRGVELVLVANRWQQVPKSSRIQFVQVGAGFDVADDHIAEQCQAGDLVITDDIPLASQVIARGAAVLRPRGEMLDERNVKQRLATRDALEEMRGAGIMTGGPPPYSDRDKQQFANALDRWLTKNL